MKSYYILLLSLFLLLGCKKEPEFYIDPSNPLEFSEDSVSFDTIFTTKGSTTRRIKIFNRSKKAIKISEILLAGGQDSPYQLNINGIPTHQFQNLEIRGLDSINLFIRVTINPNTEDLPFIVTDSIRFITDGNTQKLHLKAFGQNAIFLNNEEIAENTTWDKNLPYVIYNSLKVKEGKTLTISKGSRVYFHKGGKVEVSGTLQVNGDVKDSVTFASDRFEKIPYAEEKGQWDGIHILSKSSDNVINHATIKNALIGIRVDSASFNDKPKLLIANSIIKNMEVAGIVGYTTSVSGFNNLIFNCGRYLAYFPNGGDFNFKQNTFVNISSRTTPSLFFSDVSSSNQTLALKVVLINNIIWGSLADELIIENKGSQFNMLVRSNLVKSRDKNLEGLGNIVNKDPLFVPNSITYKLSDNSPAANSGENISGDPAFLFWLNKDKQGKERLFPSELGCYELF